MLSTLLLQEGTAPSVQHTLSIHCSMFSFISMDPLKTSIILHSLIYTTHHIFFQNVSIILKRKDAQQIFYISVPIYYLRKYLLNRKLQWGRTGILLKLFQNGETVNLISFWTSSHAATFHSLLLFILDNDSNTYNNFEHVISSGNSLEIFIHSSYLFFTVKTHELVAIVIFIL
jgi:hypothetical protein